MLDDRDMLDHLETIAREMAKVGRQTLLILRLLNGALALLLAVATYFIVESWDTYEFWVRSATITVFVVAYLVVDKYVVQGRPVARAVAPASYPTLPLGGSTVARAFSLPDNRAPDLAPRI